MQTCFLSNHCILSLFLRVMNQAKNTEGCMASPLLSNGRILSYYDTIRLKFLRCLFCGALSVHVVKI